MAKPSADQLVDALQRLRLVEPQALESLLRDQPAARTDPDTLLRLLVARNLLTSYQSSRLADGAWSELVVGGYKLLYQNASGTFARVFRAESLDDGSTVALKLLREKWQTDRATVTAFRREAEIGLRLHHPNIVRVLDVGCDSGRHYFTMEFVEGGTLRDVVRVRGRFSPVEACRCVRQLASALDHAFKRNVLHGDLRSTNVLVGADGVPKLIDFGVAGSATTASTLDKPAGRQTVEYAALEKGTSAPPGDPRTDLFFLGAVFYELLAGEPPFPPTSDYDERSRFERYVNVPPLRRSCPDVPECVLAVVEKLMRLNPNERYQTPAEVLSDLNRVLAELDRSTGEDGQTERQTVLVVENRPHVQQALRERLTREGLRVLILGDWRRAVRRVEEVRPSGTLVVASCLGREASAAANEFVRLAGWATQRLVLLVDARQFRWCEPLGRRPHVTVLRQPVAAKTLLPYLTGTTDGADTADRPQTTAGPETADRCDSASEGSGSTDQPPSS